MYDSNAATARAQCMMNSQEPPSAMPRTAATVGTRLYLRRIAVFWNLRDDRLDLGPASRLHGRRH